MGGQVGVTSKKQNLETAMEAKAQISSDQAMHSSEYPYKYTSECPKMEMQEY